MVFTEIIPMRKTMIKIRGEKIKRLYLRHNEKCLCFFLK